MEEKAKKDLEKAINYWRLFCRFEEPGIRRVFAITPIELLKTACFALLSSRTLHRSNRNGLEALLCLLKEVDSEKFNEVRGYELIDLLRKTTSNNNNSLTKEERKSIFAALKYVFARYKDSIVDTRASLIEIDWEFIYCRLKISSGVSAVLKKEKAAFRWGIQQNAILYIGVLEGAAREVKEALFKGGFTFEDCDIKVEEFPQSTISGTKRR